MALIKEIQRGKSVVFCTVACSFLAEIYAEWRVKQPFSNSLIEKKLNFSSV